MKYLRSLAIAGLVEILLPWIAWWVRRQARTVQTYGRRLHPHELAWASQVGGREPEQIRVLSVAEVPLPVPRWMRRLGARCSFACQSPAGMTLGYGILVAEAYAQQSALLIHEAVHVGQYERFGSTPRFLRAYLRQCLADGYESAPLEIEARERTHPFVL